MRPVRVAIDATPLVGAPTGIARFVAGVLPHLVTDPGLEVTGYVLSARAGPSALPSAARSTLSSPGARARSFRLPARVVHRIWAAGVTIPFGPWQGADLVHGTNFAAPPGRRSVISLHDLTPFADGPSSRASRSRARVIMRSIVSGAHLQVPTIHVRDRAVDELGADPGRITVVPYGVDPIPETSAGTGRRRVGMDRFVLALGTTTARKNVRRLLDAVAGLPADVGVVVMGPEGDAEAGVAASLADLGRSRPVRRLVDADDTARAEVLRDATVLAYPSLDEGFGFPPLEAMSVGVPVVAGAAGSVPEVTDGAALLVDPMDSGALRDALGEALDPDRAAALAEAGRLVAARHDWSLTAARLSELYRGLAA